MRRPLLLLIALALAGCDQLGIESPATTKARVEADGKAIGGACRHAGRAIEDCYTLNKKSDKAAIFAGWREMNDYMRENKIEVVAPQLGAATELAAKPAQVESGDAKAAPEDKAAKPAPGKRAAHES